ncbi:hypothetical protein ABEB36_010454 [Hypothenemus hampei]|uniref:Malate dehydrogenase, mitochondrial n=1 Tax=Hypothenemus hampei TaxID=57062 RepID=A0ABD1EJX5_HYPHA
MELALKHLFKINSAPFSSFHTSSVHHYLTKAEFQKSIQIAILGGHTRLGTYTSFLLKQNPLVSRLHLAESTEQIPNVAIDLNTFDTKCQVETYFGSEECISKAIKGADVILILPTEECNPATPLGERIMIQGKRLYNFAKQCTIYAPRALIVVNVPPISVSVPLVSETETMHEF